MKAISLTQPWAMLFALGEKKVETRSWRPPDKIQLPFTLAIHAAKGFSLDDKLLATSEPFGSVLKRRGINWFNELPLGAIIGTVQIYDVWLTEDARNWVDSQERAFGDYSDGRFAWVSCNPRMIEPIPIRGALKLWEVPTEIVEKINIKK